MAKKMRRRSRRGRQTMTRAEHLASVQRTESISIEYPLIIDFGHKALREAYRVWWHPSMGVEFERLTGHVFAKIEKGGLLRFGNSTVQRGSSIERGKLDPPSPAEKRAHAAFIRGIKPRKGFPKRGRQVEASTKAAPVKVRIVLNYPLTDVMSKTVTIDRRYPGEIFALAHDFYRQIYREDEKRGGKAGPMNGGAGPLMNRGKGPLVWGHDIGDLVFECCHYFELPKKGPFSEKTSKAFKEARISDRMSLPGRETDGAEGIFMFSIGS
jgi:hypothetical protein